MKTNIFVIITPLQLINAIEYKQQFLSSNNNYNILIIINYLKKTKKQVKSILEITAWDEIHFTFSLNSGVNSKFYLFLYHLSLPLLDLFAIKFIKRKFQKAKCFRLFVGNYHNRVCYKLIQDLQEGEKYVLDDGMNSLSIASLRKKEINEGVSHFYQQKKGIKKKAELIMLGIKRFTVPQNLKFYSAFIEEVIDGDQLIKNNFKFFSTLQEYKKSENITYFIGSPLVDLGILNPDVLLDLLKRIKDFYGDNIIYIPHRLERANSLMLIEKLMPVRPLSVPIEFELITSHTIPIRIASFYSAALITTHKLFKDIIEINSFVLPYNLVKKFKTENLDLIYSKIKENKCNTFKVITEY